MSSVVLATADGSTHDAWLESMMATSPPSSTVRIHKVPTIVRDTKDYKYYVPKVVSIGPYHYDNPKLQLAQNLKPLFMNKLFSNNKETLQKLLCKLGGMVQELRDLYEDKSTDAISNEEFTRMMMLDGCFILYYIKALFSFGSDEEYHLPMKSHMFPFVNLDLFLLENQIPFLVMEEVMKEVKDQDWHCKIDWFINDNVFVSKRPESGSHFFRSACPILFSRTNSIDQADPSNDTRSVGNDPSPIGDHLLQLLQHRLIGDPKLLVDNEQIQNSWYTFRNVKELSDIGIHFKTSKTISLAHINLEDGGWWSANLELPRIRVDGSTKPLFLNLIAYEMCSNVENSYWVTSYICLLDDLIDHPEDVKILRKAGVIHNFLGSDSEVAELFNEVATDSVPDGNAYIKTRSLIQVRYDSKTNERIWQFRQEYFKSPWSFMAFVGAILALLLGAVQAFFSVWSRPSECDGLCVALKKNHHL